YLFRHVNLYLFGPSILSIGAGISIYCSCRYYNAHSTFLGAFNVYTLFYLFELFIPNMLLQFIPWFNIHWSCCGQFVCVELQNSVSCYFTKEVRRGSIETCCLM